LRGRKRTKGVGSRFMETSAMFVGLPREEAFKRIFDHVQGKKYLLIWRKREYNITKAVFPSRIEVRMDASWGTMGKLSIEVVPSDGGSSIHVSFKPVSGKTVAVGSVLMVFLTGIFKTFLLPIVGAVTSPVFLSWFNIYSAKGELLTELKQLFQNHTSSPNID
jgi:hypothetical protein